MSDEPMNRRGLMREAGRLALAGGLAGALGLLVMRKPGEGADCIKAIACGGCGANGNCEFPKAMIWRETRAAGISKGADYVG